jgi:hypothetical protein
MSSDFQTIAALVVVALTAVWLVVRSVRKRSHSACGGGECGAISRDVKELQAKLKSR